MYATVPYYVYGLNILTQYPLLWCDLTGLGFDEENGGGLKREIVTDQEEEQVLPCCMATLLVGSGVWAERRSMHGHTTCREWGL